MRSTARSYSATIIREGPGNSRDSNFYTREALADAVRRRLFEGLRCYLNHASDAGAGRRPEADVRRLAGHFTDARLVEANGRASVVARFVPGGMDPDGVRNLIESALAAGDAELIGVSIDGYGLRDGTREVDGRSYNLIRRIDSLSSAVL